MAGLLVSPLGAQTVDGQRSEPPAVYAVQLGSFETASKAEAERDALAKRGDLRSPLQVAARDGRYVILLGPFSNGAEPQIWKRQLRSAEAGSGAFVITISKESLPSAAVPLPSVFNAASLEAKQQPLASMRGIPAYEQLQALDVRGNEDAYREALEAALPSCGDSDPMRGYIIANLGILDLKAGKEHYEAALDKLSSVAEGKVVASASVRTMAMARSAWLIHQLGDRERALCAWRETRLFSSSQSVQARCRSEEMGLLMELAESGKGNHDEVRRMITQALEETPEGQIKWRAVMELIFSETFARQPKRDAATSAQLSEGFLQKYTPLNDKGLLDRELGTAKYQAGLFHEWAGHTDEALSWYQRTLAEVPEDFDGFLGYHPRAEALGGLARIAAASDNIQLRDEILADILRDYPDSEMGRKVAEGWPKMAREIIDDGKKVK